MALKSNTHHPSFIIGALSFLLFLCGIALRVNSFPAGDYVILSGLACGGIHWVWSVVDVFRNRLLLGDSRIFWIIIVLLIPPLGGMLYYLMRRKNVQL